jgi:two-component system, probable response regulator PhcQ
VESAARPLVLFVDDEPAVTAALKRVLHRQPWRVLEASSGEEALEILAREDIAVIVSDEQMPGMSGSELLARVRRVRPGTVRMILTGQASLAAAIRSINEGEIRRFFLKPCDEAALVEAIRAVLQERAAEEPSRAETAHRLEERRELRTLESHHPGITRVVRTSDGVIDLDADAECGPLEWTDEDSTATGADDAVLPENRGRAVTPESPPAAG